MLERFEREFAAWLGTDDAVAVSSGTAALHLGVRALGWGARRRGRHHRRSASSRRPTACSTRTRGRSSATSTRRPSNIDPEAAEAACGERTAGLLPVHLFGYPADMDALEALAAARGLGIVEDACEAFGAVDSGGMKVGSRGNIATFAFYANKQIATGEGGMLVVGRLRHPAPGAQRAKPGPRRRHGLARARPPRASTTGSPTWPRRSAWRRSSAPTSCSRRARASRRMYARAPRGDRGPRRCPAPTAARSGAAGSSTWCSCRAGVDRDARDPARWRSAGVASKGYLPCIHLQPFYRERFGFRGGEFPVAEDVSARSLALPVLRRGWTEEQVDRVCERCCDGARPRSRLIARL